MRRPYVVDDRRSGDLENRGADSSPQRDRSRGLAAAAGGAAAGLDDVGADGAASRAGKPHRVGDDREDGQLVDQHPARHMDLAR